MKLKNIFFATFLSLGITRALFSIDIDAEPDHFFTPIANTMVLALNIDDAWDDQDKVGLLYLSIGINSFINNINSKGSNSGWNGIFGYNMSKYFAVQYNQFATYNSMFGGLAEGVVNLPIYTMFTPYVAGGAGWANLAGQATGSWDVGGGLKFNLSHQMQVNVNYRYIQTIAPNPASGVNQQANARASANMVSASLTWFFSGYDTSTSISNIQDSGITRLTKTQAKIDESKYVLPRSIEQCEDNYNLTKNDVAYYTSINGGINVIHLNTRFAYDSVYLDSKNKNTIASLVSSIKDTNITFVTVKGYASQGQTGDEFEVYNQKLSERRADLVAAYIKDLGIDAGKINSEGFGYYSTLEGFDVSDAANQRVEVSIATSVTKT